jgi:hypothetical protein
MVFGAVPRGTVVPLDSLEVIELGKQGKLIFDLDGKRVLLTPTLSPDSP